MPQAIPALVVAIKGITLMTVVKFVAKVAIFYVLSRVLTKKPNFSSGIGNSNNNRLLLIRNPVSPRRIVYGETKLSGTLLFASVSGTSNEYLNLVIAIAGHECEALGDTYFGAESVPLDGSGNATGKYAGYCIIKKHLGDAAQTVDTFLQTAVGSGVWSNDHRLRGVAYLVVQLKHNADLFSNQIPDVAVITKGKKVYDPRTTLTAWTDNAALCVRDYLADSTIGLGAPTADIPDADAIEAANISDEDVDLAAGGTQKRYTLNGAFETSIEPGEIISAMLTAMAGSLVYSGGKWFIRAGAYRTPTVTLDENDLRAGITVTTKASRRDSVNRVKGTFVGPENQYQPADFPAVVNSTYLTEDGGEELWKDIELPFTNTAAAAQRLAKIELERARQAITVVYPAKLTAFRLMGGNTVMINNTRFGWVNKVFEIVEWGLSFNQQADGVMIGVDLTLRETAAAVWDWNDGLETQVDPAPNTTLLDPTVVDAPAAPTLSTSNFVQSDGTIMPRLKVDMTASSNSFVTSGGFRIVEYKKTSDTEWQTWSRVRGDAVEDYILDVQASISYDVRLRDVNVYGVTSLPSTTATAVVSNDTTAPAKPTNFTALGTKFGNALDWDENAEADLKYYRVYRRLASEADDIAGATLIWTGLASAWIDPTATVAVAYRYWVRAVDTTNNASVPSDPATGTSLDPTGPKGDQGDPGEPGDDGLDGATGPAGTGQWTMVYYGTGGSIVHNGGGEFEKTSGSSAWVSGAFHSLESFVNGAFISFRPGPVAANLFFGLNTDPTTTNDYWDVDYAFHLDGTNAYIYESGSSVLGLGGYALTDVFTIKYDGAQVQYLKNGVVVRTVPAAAGLKLYLDGAIFATGGIVRDLVFGPAGTQGTGQFTLITDGDMVHLGGGTLTKIGTGGAWDSQGYSSEGYVNGAYTSFFAGQSNKRFMVGLNTDPTADDSYSSLDYAWYCQDDGNCTIYENGGGVSGHGAYTTATVFAIFYDGVNVRYLKDGTVVRTVAASANLKLHMDSSALDTGAIISSIRFGPTGSKGDTGLTGPKGDDGDPGAIPNDHITTIMMAAGAINTIAAAFTSAITTSTGIVQTVTISATGDPILVNFACGVYFTGPFFPETFNFRIKEDGIEILAFPANFTHSPTAMLSFPIMRQPSAGSHTYTLEWDPSGGSWEVSHRSIVATLFKKPT